MALRRILSEMEVGGKAHAVTQDIGIFGYVLVGSSAYLPSGGEPRDIDIVLLAHGHAWRSALGYTAVLVQEDVALRSLCKALKPMDNISLWYERLVLVTRGPSGLVQAVACLVKVLSGECTMDILYVSGCEPIGDGTRQGNGLRSAPRRCLVCVAAGDALRVLPTEAEGRPVDCLRLTSIITRSVVH